MRARVLLLILPLLGPFTAPSLSAQSATSENNQRLKNALARFPQADTNKDGVLTMEEGLAFLATQKKNQVPGKAAGGAGRQKHILFDPSDEEVEKAIALGREQNRAGQPLSFPKEKGVRLVMTGHSWVAPGRKSLEEIAAGAGLGGHHQRFHISGGGTGSANAIWLKEFGKWEDNVAPNPVLLPAIATGQWDVMTWGCYYEDKPEYYTQWIDLCLEYNPDMTFLLQDGWPRFLPDYEEMAAADIRAALEKDQAEFANTLFRPAHEQLNEKYPGKVNIIPASYAVVDLIGRFYDGKIPDLDCVDERTHGGKKGIYRDGGHLSRSSGVEHLVGYLYYGMLYRQSPALIEGYRPNSVPESFDPILREIAWKAIVDSPFTGIDDSNGDGRADGAE